MIMPAGMTILTRAAGPAAVGRVMGVIGVPMLLGPIVGPILGGWLVDDVSWRWIFFVNVPIGAVALVLASRAPARRPSPAAARLGSAWRCFPPASRCCLRPRRVRLRGGFGHAQGAVPMVAGIVAIAVFVCHALRTRRGADRPEAVPATGRSRSSSLTLFCRHLVLRRDAAAAALPPGRPRRVGAPRRPAAGAAGLRRDDRDAVRRRLTDRTGVGRIVPVGLILSRSALLGLAQLAAESYWTARRAPFVWASDGRDDDADHVGAHTDAAPRRGPARDDGAEHQPAGRRLDRHRGADRPARQRARRPAAGSGSGGIGAAALPPEPRPDRAAWPRLSPHVLVGARARRGRVRRLTPCCRSTSPSRSTTPTRSRAKRARRRYSCLASARRSSAAPA